MDAIIGLSNLEEAKPRAAPTGLEGKGTYSDAVRDLISTYHDLNPTTIDELSEEPSPLEFMRYVSRNRPFLVRRGASSFRACQKWSASYLTTTMGDSPVNVAITPHGNADSILPISDTRTTTTKRKGTTNDNSLLFIKPHETTSPFTPILHKIQAQETQPKSLKSPTTLYAQTQNDNLRNEYSTLFSDVPTSIPFARIALQRDPDAINFWLGNSHSVTALHKDNYENIYVQVLGKKHFVLLPPVESACVNEKGVLAATYVLKGGGESGEDGLVVRIDEPREYVPFATWDPDVPEERATEYSNLSRPLRVTLEEGDMLYLPALWYHKVSQSCSEDGICCAVNYWYDLEFGGSFWAMSTFVRGVGLLSLQERGELEVASDAERQDEVQDTEQH